MKTVSDFSDYKLLGTSNGYKKEKWGSFTLLRPDPEIIWNDKKHRLSITGGSKGLE